MQPFLHTKANYFWSSIYSNEFLEPIYNSYLILSDSILLFCALTFCNQKHYWIFVFYTSFIIQRSNLFPFFTHNNIYTNKYKIIGRLYYIDNIRVIQNTQELENNFYFVSWSPVWLFRRRKVLFGCLGGKVLFGSSGGVIPVPSGQVRGASEIPEKVWDWK